MAYLPEFAETLNQALTRLDRSPAWLAQRLGVNASTVSRWLNQSGRPADPEMVVRLADVLGLTAQLSELLAAAGYGYVESGPAPAPAPPPAAAQPDLPPVQRQNLPVSLTPLFGRAEEERELVDLLARPDVRLVTVTGPGGMGKSRLALAVGTALQEAFADGVFWVALAPLQQSEEMVTAIAEAVDFPFQRDSRPPKRQLLDYLARKRMLLLLDNCEHLLEGIGLVSEMLGTAPGVKVLATSRERLRLSGESVYGLDGIDFRAAGDDGASQAAQLFLHGVGLVRPGYTPGPQESAHIAHICRLVQGMPLALLLAATWAEVLSPAEIARQIATSLDFLEADLRDLPERQRSLRAVFDHSWARLSAAEQAVFARLSVFLGEFQLQAAQEVAQTSLRTLMGLAQKSLLTRTLDERFVLHELLRQYGAEKLRGMAGEEEATQQRHAAYYLGWLREQTPELYRTRQLVVMAELQAAWENVRLAWLRAGEWGEAELLAGAARALAYYCEWYGLYHEAVELFRSGLAGLAGDNTATGQAAHIQLLVPQARFERLLGRPSRCAQLLNSAESLLEQLPTSGADIRALQAHLLSERAELLINTDKTAAMAVAHRSLALYEAVDDDPAMAAVLFTMGEISSKTGDKIVTIPLLEESLAISRRLGGVRETADKLRNLGFNISSIGQWRQAEDYVREGCALTQGIGNRASLVQAERDLGGIAQWRGDFAAAEEVHTRCRRAFDELGDRYRSLETGMLEVLFLTQQAKYVAAEDLGQAMLAAAREMEQKEMEGSILLFLSRVAQAQGRVEDAYRLAQASAAVFAASGGSRVPGIAYTALAIAASDLGRAEEARSHIIRALEVGLRSGSLTPLWICVTTAGLVQTYDGDLLRAVELDALAMSNPQMANDRWHAEVVRRPLLERIAHLPADEIAQARERGRSLDLKTVATQVLAEFKG
ncbi:MAG: helix-turn-helix domain-containing protein [Caldilineaceae bacterium]|nr:helix-turn-helix domain-containing protein [Caldilineaceae bacterium]